jgi:hypothetical protein
VFIGFAAIEEHHIGVGRPQAVGVVAGDFERQVGHWSFVRRRRIY